MTTPPPTLKPLNARRVVLLALGASAALGLLIVVSVAVFAYAKVRAPRDQPDRYALFLALMDERHPGGDDALRFYESFLSDASSPLLQLGAPGQTGDEIIKHLRHATQMLAYTGWDDPTHASARAALTGALPVLDALSPVVGMQRLRPLDERRGDPQPGMLEALHYGNPWIETVSAVWRLADINTFAIADAAERADWDETLSRLRVSRAIAGHLGGVPHSYTSITGTHIEILAGVEAVRAARNPNADLRAVEALLREMETPPRFDPDAQRLFEGETLVILDIAHARYTGRAPSVAAVLQPGFDDFRARVERFRDATEAWMRLPHATRGDAPASDDYFGKHDPHAFPPPVVEHWMAPDFPMLARRMWSVETYRAATLANLRLERFRRTHGRLPAMLEEALTRDQTLDPVSGEPFEYEINSDGKTYRLLAPPGATHLNESERDLSFVRPEIPAYITGVRPDPLAIPGEQPQP